MQSASVVLLFVVISVISITFQVRGNAKARDLIDVWAEQEGVSIISKKFLFNGGKFFFSRSKTQRVYRVVVQTKEGRQRTADVKCGSFFGGMLSGDTSVRWHD